jgi:WD40 repeat protein
VLWDISDIAKPSELSTLPTTAKYTNIVAFSPDGRTIATAADDYTVQLWDITDPLHATPMGSSLHSHKGAIQVTFSPDGKTLASGSDDGSVLLWDITDRDHPAAIGDSLIPPGVASRTRVAFDPHGRLYVAGRDGTIRTWNLDTGTDNAIERICASTRNVLTEQRWNQVLPSLPYDPPCPRGHQVT